MMHDSVKYELNSSNISKYVLWTNNDKVELITVVKLK